MRPLVCLLSLLLTSLALSQPLIREWIRTEPPSYDAIRGVYPDRNGNIISVGRTPVGLSNSAVIATQYDVNGIRRWRRVLDFDSLFSVSTSDAEGNVYIVGGYRPNCRIVKIDTSGVIRWQVMAPPDIQWNSIGAGPDGSVVVTGNTHSSLRLAETTRIHPDGTIAWADRFPPYGTSGLQDAGQVVVDTSGNAFLLVRYSNSPGLKLIKYSPDGVHLLTRAFSEVPYSFRVRLGLLDGRNPVIATYAPILAVRQMDSYGTVTQVSQPWTPYLTNPFLAPIRQLSDGSFIVSGCDYDGYGPRNGFRIRLKGALSETSPSTPVLATANGLGEEFYAAGYEQISNVITRAVISARFNAAPLRGGIDDWRGRIYGWPDPSTYIRISEFYAVTTDSQGDVVAGGRVTTGYGVVPIVVKYRTVPQGATDVVNVPLNTLKDLPAPGVLANDAHRKMATLILAEPPLHGNLTLRADGSLTYVPNQGYWGVDRATYKLQRGADFSTATIEFRVYPPLIDARFIPDNVVGGAMTMLHATADRPFPEVATLPVTVNNPDVLMGSGSLIIERNATTGSTKLRTTYVYSTQTASATVRSGVYTRTATITIRRYSSPNTRHS